MIVLPLSKALLQVNFFGEESLQEKAAVFQPLRDLSPVLVRFAAALRDPSNNNDNNKIACQPGLGACGASLGLPGRALPLSETLLAPCDCTA